MNRIYNILSKCIALLLAGSCAIVPATAQTQRYNATAENGYGIVYSLPKTEIEIQAVVVERTYTPGELNPWANKHLGITPTSHEQKTYEIVDMSVRPVGVPDTESRYLVAFDKKSIAPFARLAPGNILYSINGDAELPLQQPTLQIPEEIIPSRVMPTLPREYSLATTRTKRADVAATYIYDLREHIMGVVTGEAENLPKDGEALRIALEHLRSEESRTLRLFLGDTTQRVRVHTWRITPRAEDMVGHILFRFSPDWGVLNADDLSGDPVRLDLKVIERAPQLDEKESKKRDKIEGIAYNMPGKADVSIRLGRREITKARLPITQLGTIQYLSRRMFNLKDGATTAIYLSPVTGELLRITNEQ